MAEFTLPKNSRIHKGKRFAATGEHLVRIGLVAHIPHDAIVRCLVDIMERDGELDRAEPRREMPAARGDILDQEIP